MEMPSKESILFNGGAVFIIVLGAGAMVKAILAPDEIEPCTARYFQGTVLEIARDDGTPASPGEMQSKIGVNEWGVIDNLRIESSEEQPQSLVMRVGLSRAKDEPRRGNGQRGGVGFNWDPGFPGGQRSACLSYKILIPGDFNYSRGGLLPGLHGGSPSDEEVTSDGFAVRLRWDANGKGGIRNDKQGDQTTKTPGRNSGEFDLPKEKWISLEQEVTLNSPGAENGSLNIWVDGELVMSETGMNFRTKPGSRFLGVRADTHYRQVRGHRRADKAQSLLMTPFELRWQ